MQTDELTGVVAEAIAAMISQGREARFEFTVSPWADAPMPRSNVLLSARMLANDRKFTVQQPIGVNASEVERYHTVKHMLATLVRDGMREVGL